jgi:hypothetical protein
MQPANAPTKASKVEGFVTDASCSVDIFALDYDRCTGAQKTRILATQIGTGGANPIGRFRWDASKANLNDNQLLPAYKNLQVHLTGCAAAFVPTAPVLVGGGGAQIIASQYQAPVSGVWPLYLHHNMTCDIMNNAHHTACMLLSVTSLCARSSVREACDICMNETVLHLMRVRYCVERCCRTGNVSQAHSICTATHLTHTQQSTSSLRH